MLSNNSAPDPLRSSGANSLEDLVHIGLTGMDRSSNEIFPCPASFSGSANQYSPYSRSETWACTPDYSIRSSISLPVTRQSVTPPAQPASSPLPASPLQSASPPSRALNPNRTKTSCAGSAVRKRNLNTLAARRYRQKRIDETQSLADELKETQAERDVLKIHVARLESELKVLRETLNGQRLK